MADCTSLSVAVLTSQSGIEKKLASTLHLQGAGVSSARAIHGWSELQSPRTDCRPDLLIVDERHGTVGRPADLLRIMESQPGTIAYVISDDPSRRSAWQESGAIQSVAGDEFTDAVAKSWLSSAIHSLRLRRDQEDLAGLCEEMSDGVVIASCATAEILHVNRAACDMFGCQAEDLVGRMVVHLHPPEQREAIERQFAEHVLGHGVRCEEMPCIRANGEVFHADLVVRVHHFGGQRCSVGFFRDVTTRRRARLEAEAIRRLARRLTGPVDEYEMGEIVADEARQIFRHDAFILSAFDDARGELHALYGEDTPEGEANPSPVELERIARSAMLPSPTLVNRAEEPRETPFSPFGVKGRLSRSLMFAPLRWEGHVVGLISVQSYTPDRYTRDDLSLLEAFADQCGGTIARLQAEHDREQIEVSLRTSLRDNRALIEAIPDMVVRQRRDGTYLDIKPAIEFIMYRPLDEMLGRRMQDVMPPELVRIAEERHARALATGKVEVYEFHLPAGESVHSFESRVVPCGEDELLILVRDITGRERAERERETLRRLAHRLTGPLDAHALGRVLAEESRKLFNHDAFLLAELHSDSRVFCPLYGEDIVASGQGPTEVPVGSVDQTVAPSEATLINRSEEPTATPFRRFGATDRLSRSLMFAPVRWEGQEMGVLSVQSYTPGRYTHADLALLEVFADQCGGALARLREQEARRRIETSLAESESLFRVLVEAMPAALFMIRGTRVTQVNPQAAELTGYSEPELLTMSLWELLHPSEQRTVDAWRGVAEEPPEDLERSELHLVTKEGEDRWADFSIRRMSSGEEPVMLAVAIDITDRKRAERLAALGMTASSLAHHIKNIQTHLVGATSLLDAGLRGANQETVARAWPIVKHASERIARLVRNMLALARDRSSADEEVDINAVIDEVVEVCRNRAEERHIELRTELSPALAPSRADPVALHDCVLNLVSNAIDAFHEAGRPERRVVISTAHAPTRGVNFIRVADTGPGMEPHVLERLFEPFFTTKGSRGTGLGLPVVRRIAEAYGGSVRVRTQLGVGSVFTVEIPSVSQEARSRP